MSEKVTLFELLNERIEKEDIIKLVCDYDNKFNELEEENKRLNNIINELEKWIKENNLGKYRTENVVNTDELLDKLQELKGSDKK